MIRTAIVLAALVLGGCTQPTPGYVDPNGRPHLLSLWDLRDLGPLTAPHTSYFIEAGGEVEWPRPISKLYYVVAGCNEYPHVETPGPQESFRPSLRLRGPTFLWLTPMERVTTITVAAERDLDGCHDVQPYVRRGVQPVTITSIHAEPAIDQSLLVVVLR